MPEQDFLDRFWGWIKTKHSQFWNIVGWAATFMVAASFICWAIGWQCNFLLIGWILGGLYCIWRIARNRVELAERLSRNIIFYLGLIITTVCFFLVFFPSTLLYMYSNWENSGGGIIGALLIFGPIIGLAAGATALTILTTERKWSIRWIKFSVVVCILGLLGFRFIRPGDKWLNEKVITLVEYMDADRLNVRGSHGLYARAKGDIKVYYRDPNTDDSVFLFVVDNTKAPEILRVMARDPFTDKAGVDYLQVLIGELYRYVRLKDVKVLAGAKVEEDENCRIVKDGDTWYVYFFSDEPVKLTSDWRTVIVAQYDNSSDSFPWVSNGRAEFKLPNMGEAGPSPSDVCSVRWEEGKFFKLHFLKK